jgi:uncharacterized protein YihD (DUF1040 family)
MKDPNRIPIILELLGMYWEKHPDKDLLSLIDDLAEENGPSSEDLNIYDDDSLREDLFNKVKTRWTLR